MKKSKMLALALAIVLCVPGCGQASDIHEKQQALKQEGMELQASGDYSGAIAKYEEALKLSDMKVGAEEIDLAYYKASAQYRSGDLTGAIDTYSAILAVKESESSYLGRGLLYVAANDAQNAEEDLNKVLKETDNPLIKGIIYNVVDQTDKAKECFEEAKASGDSDAVFYLANIYEKAGDHNYAMILLEEYIAGGNASAEGYLTVARHYYNAGTYDQALAMVQAGIALGDSGVMKSLLEEEIACYEKLSDFATARTKAEDYLDKYPEDTAMQKEYEFLNSR
ncbi:MAG: tetratricopeptide repeat protein [Lachnospiraceae bacterium]|nr:tetratricopeptide repeat protein [Lachnospiraceae bacterium]